MNTFEKVKKLAYEKGIPVSTLESEAGLAKGAIHKWKTKSPTIRSAAKVAKVLECTIDDLKPDEK